MNKQEQIRELNYLGHEASKLLKNNSVIEAYNKIFLFCILNVNFCEEMPHNFRAININIILKKMLLLE